jgi:hypothetical protein
MDAAEAAIEWAANTRMMHGGALAEERGPQVLLNWKAMKG